MGAPGPYGGPPYVTPILRAGAREVLDQDRARIIARDPLSPSPT
jgi:hypothetical protein